MKRSDHPAPRGGRPTTIQPARKMTVPPISHALRRSDPFANAIKIDPEIAQEIPSTRSEQVSRSVIVDSIYPRLKRTPFVIEPLNSKTLLPIEHSSLGSPFSAFPVPNVQVEFSVKDTLCGPVANLATEVLSSSISSYKSESQEDDVSFLKLRIGRTLRCEDCHSQSDNP